MCYAQRYHSVLDSGDASILVQAKPSVRRHAMESLAAWSKFIGSYEQWGQIKKRYSLQWTDGDESLQAIQRYFNGDNLEDMLQRIREMMYVLPTTSMSKIVHWGIIVGLRSSEIIDSVRFINDKEAFTRYYDPAQMTLSHWKMPGMIRKTKKAFLSFVTPQMLESVQNLGEVPTYNSIRHACNRRGIACNLHLCRKVFASYLRQEGGIQPEVIDMLQGRVSQSVLARHYLVPQRSLKDEVLQALQKLKQRIE
jgi:Archaeal phage integrase